MTELKTLKDLEKAQGHRNLGWASIYDLKQEAIKWIKYLRDKHNHVGEPFWTDIVNKSYQEGTTWEDYDERILFIKHFFNITEEDLK